MKKTVFFTISLGSGGAERVISTLLNELAKTSRCYLILIHNKIDYALDERVCVIDLGAALQSTGLMRYLRPLWLTYKLTRIIKKEGFKQINSFLERPNFINIAASFFTGHRAIISQRTMPSSQHAKGLQGRINKALIWLAYPRAAVCIANSKTVASELERSFGLKNVVTLPNLFNEAWIRQMAGEDLSQDPPQDLGKDLMQDLAQDPKQAPRFVFVSVGRLDAGKNHAMIIDAIKDLNAALLIIGSGELQGALREQIKALGLAGRVLLLGARANPFAYIARADCFVFGSNYEGFPNVIVEALICGAPVISTDCPGGVREILAPGTDPDFHIKNGIELATHGILTPVGDAKALQAAMRLMMQDDVLRAKYAARSQKGASRYFLRALLPRYADLCNFEDPSTDPTPDKI
ncbi:MAG: glycosyltransferase [Helicobacteraceae bacterium]